MERMFLYYRNVWPGLTKKRQVVKCVPVEPASDLRADFLSNMVPTNTLPTNIYWNMSSGIDIFGRIKLGISFHAFSAP